MAVENVDALKIDTQPAQVSIAQLRKQLKELKGTLLSTTAGTDEYNKALRQSAEITHALSEQQREIKQSSADVGTVFSNIGKVAGGMVAGFQAGKAAMKLFGVENENVLKGLEQMQSLMAMTQALPALHNAMDAFKGLRDAIAATTGATSKFGKALISTGLGALVAALGYVIANFDEISKWLDKITGQTDFVGEVAARAMGILKAGMAGALQTVKALGSALVTYIAAPVKSVMAAIEAYTSTEGGIAEKLKAAGKAMKDEFVGEWKDTGKQFKEIGDAAAKAYIEGYNKQKENRKKLSKEEIERIKKEVEEARKELLKLRETTYLFNKSDLDKEIAKLDKAQSDAIKILDNAKKKKLITDEEYEKEKSAIEQHYDNERAKTRTKAEKERLDKLIADTSKAMKTEGELQLLLLQQQYDKGEVDLVQYLDRKKELQEAYWQDYIDGLQFIIDTESNLSSEQLTTLQTQINEARGKLKSSTASTTTEGTSSGSTDDVLLSGLASGLSEAQDILTQLGDNPAWGNIISNISQCISMFQEWNEKQKTLVEGTDQYKEQMAAAYLSIASVGMNAMSQLFQGIAAEQDTQTKEGFETSKKMQIASATMTTLSSVLQALAAGNSMASQMGLAAPVGWAMGAAMATMVGALGATNIAKIAKQKFGGSSSGVSSTPSMSGIGSVVAPVQYTQDVRGAEIESSIKNQRVYVVESDITDAQNRVSVAESEATF